MKAVTLWKGTMEGDKISVSLQLQPYDSVRHYIDTEQHRLKSLLDIQSRGNWENKKEKPPKNLTGSVCMCLMQLNVKWQLLLKTIWTLHADIVRTASLKGMAF